MPEENFKKQIPEPVFPEESALIIGKILEIYNFLENQKEGIKKFIDSKNPSEKMEIFENLPGARIAKLVRDHSEGKISLELISIRLEKELKISEKTAQQITKDLEKTLLIFIKQKPAEEREMLAPEISGTEATLPEKPETLPKKDVYREPLE